MAVISLSVNIALFYLDTARNGIYSTDLLLTHEVITNLLIGTVNAIFVIMDLGFPTTRTDSLSFFKNGSSNNINVTIDIAKDYDTFRLSQGFATRSLSTPGAISVFTLGLSMFIVGSMSLDKLIRRRNHLEPDSLRCDLIAAQVETASLLDWAMGWHGTALSNIFVIIVSSANYFSCLAAEAVQGSNVVTE